MLRFEDPAVNLAPREPHGTGRRIEIGDAIGPYRVVGRLPGGALLAVHEGREQRVVITVWPREGWRGAVVAMLRASRAAEGLTHPGIAPVVDRGMLPDRRPWMAAEVPSGVGLYDLIARRAMSPAEAAGLVHDLAEVLAYAHERGVAHGSLTMGAVLLATGARAHPVCIVDWGTAIEDLGVYRAPEGGPRDARGDIYSLGVIAFRAATGRFPRGKIVDVPGVPVGLAALLVRMLAPDPADRPTAAEIRARSAALVAAATGPSRPRSSRPRWTPLGLLAITSESRPSATGEMRVPEPAD